MYKSNTLRSKSTLIYLKNNNLIMLSLVLLGLAMAQRTSAKARTMTHTVTHKQWRQVMWVCDIRLTLHMMTLELTITIMVKSSIKTKI